MATKKAKTNKNATRAKLAKKPLQPIRPLVNGTGSGGTRGG